MSKSKLEKIFFWITIVIAIIFSVYGIWKEHLDIEYKRAVISASEELLDNG